MPTMSTKQKSDPPRSFEDDLQRLEQLVQQMEGRDLSLEQMITAYEEGSTLVKECTKRLNDVEQKIEKLVKKESKIEPETMQPSSDEEDAV